MFHLLIHQFIIKISKILTEKDLKNNNTHKIHFNQLIDLKAHLLIIMIFMYKLIFLLIYFNSYY